jgi:tRNA pseudouridine38-40 synthase
VRNIKLLLEYDGSEYHGWQSQINAAAVHDILKAAVIKLTGEETSLVGAGRTDAGVHALGQTANFHTSSSIPADRFAYALNSMLPEDLVIKHSCEVGPDFHSRFSAKGKKYRYLIYNSSFRSPLLRNRAFHITSPLDADGMRKAAQFFVGTHDFSAFRATGGSAVSPVRTIFHSELKKDNDLITFEISGDGFLYNMVRIIAGTLAEVGLGRISPDAVPGIIEGRDRKRAGRTAPPQGLYLVEVYY